MTRTALVLLALCLCACKDSTQSSAPPEQKKIAPHAPNPMMMLDMNDPDIASHIVRDVHDAMNAPWRWTMENPTLKLLLASNDKVKFKVDFSIWDQGFKQTGPVTVAFLVNSHEIDKVKYTSPGEKHYEKAIPADMLPQGAETMVGMSIDKVYVSPTDGFRAGVILSRIGFVH